VDVTFERQPKEQRILSVGRFSTAAHTKKQAELMSVFGMLGGSGSGWRYSSVGGLNSRQQNHDYFAQVRQAGMELGADVEANLSRSALKCLYERSSIYWHATGFGDDTERRPELAEHFGISTVEAMAAGCVPVVINKGGQAEIVTHGVTGFLWNTLEELRDYTRQLMRDPALRERMSEAAQERARRFSTDRFLSEMSRQCGVGM
jgi:glycosyltransferase involved in cell wall biosynthesis